MSGVFPNFVGCGISTAEVEDLCSRNDNILLILTESIAKDFGYELVACLKARYNEKIRILYVLHDCSLAGRIQSINVDAFVLASSSNSSAIAKALVTISAGKTYFDPAIIRAFHEYKVPRLTKREGQVLKLLEEGMSNKEIAKELLISPVTVRDYVECLMHKFDSSNRTLVVTKARNKGML
jgi:DNA-binding NarL/FixJ family response regulator